MKKDALTAVLPSRTGSADGRLEGKAITSSRSRMRGFLMRARAMAMRCFWPPDSWMPPGPSCNTRHTSPVSPSTQKLQSYATVQARSHGSAPVFTR